MAVHTHLQQLEAESIEVMREVVAQADNPVMLYSVGKTVRPCCMLRKKHFPGAPFPLLHVDTTWKFQDMYNLRQKAAYEAGMELLVHQNPDAQAQGINPFDHGALHTDMWKTEGLKQALEKYQFDAAFGGARRDEEKSRAKERIFPFAAKTINGIRKTNAPNYGLYIMRAKSPAKACVFPMSGGPAGYLAIYQRKR